ncbi:Pre-mRNA-splicing factor of RES complex-domain-containing protein [Amylocystis lapponica]|nr:Pre-mRNA-splicing factor of RES complex-domain-containing protein [Amylocystis lapponica]
MQAYLAQKYMSEEETQGYSYVQQRWASTIKDHDLLGWDNGALDVEDDDMEDAVVASDRRFKKRQRTEESSGWATGEPTTAADEQPMVVEETQPAFTGGLLTSAQLKKSLPRSKPAQSAESVQQDREAVQETVYRDASGRRIDTAAERAEAARKKREREEAEARKLEWGKGVVQREEAERRKREEDAMRSHSFARGRDDVALNEDQKAQDRWNDPAATFLTASATKKRTKGPRKPEYTGPPPPPNRFGIRPGYRWDGVDRGNGFENKLFQRQNDRRRRGAESYEWSVDDM